MKYWTNLDARIPILIALTAFFGAGAAWRASWAETETTASYLRALQQYMQQTMRIQHLEWQVEQDLRYVARYQAHVRAWRLLESRARDLAVKDPLRTSLEVQAQAELALARALQPFFQIQQPDFGDKDGVVAYNGGDVLEQKLTQDFTVRGYDPTLMEEHAARMHLKALALLGVVVLFVAALLLLTVAELWASPIRRWWAAAGLWVIVAGVAGGILAEWVFR
jgi:hypothetical protein